MARNTRGFAHDYSIISDWLLDHRTKLRARLFLHAFGAEIDEIIGQIEEIDIMMGEAKILGQIEEMDFMMGEAKAD